MLPLPAPAVQVPDVPGEEGQRCQADIDGLPSDLREQLELVTLERDRARARTQAFIRELIADLSSTSLRASPASADSHGSDRSARILQALIREFALPSLRVSLVTPDPRGDLILIQRYKLSSQIYAALTKVSEAEAFIALKQRQKLLPLTAWTGKWEILKNEYIFLSLHQNFEIKQKCICLVLFKEFSEMFVHLRKVTKVIKTCNISCEENFRLQSLSEMR